MGLGMQSIVNVNAAKNNLVFSISDFHFINLATVRLLFNIAFLFLFLFVRPDHNLTSTFFQSWFLLFFCVCYDNYFLVASYHDNQFLELIQPVS